MNKILETPYNTQNWKIELHRVGDVVVMDVRKGEFLSQSTPQSLKMQYWGHKFEACCGGSDVVDVESEWCERAFVQSNGNVWPCHAMPYFGSNPT